MKGYEKMPQFILYIACKSLTAGAAPLTTTCVTREGVFSILCARVKCIIQGCARYCKDSPRPSRTQVSMQIILEVSTLSMNQVSGALQVECQQHQLESGDRSVLHHLISFLIKLLAWSVCGVTDTYSMSSCFRQRVFHSDSHKA